MGSISKSPQATPFLQKVTSYGFKGLVLKLDPALLSDGQYSEATNIISIQEGTITQRPGSRRITDNTSFGGTTAGVVVGIFKLHVGPNLDYYYAGTDGDFGNIYRATGPIPATGASMALTKIAEHCSADFTVTFTARRFAATMYSAGSIGTPYIFFACPAKMLKDNGTIDNSGDGYLNSDTLIQRWGIIPPTEPVFAQLDVLTILPAVEIVSGSLRVNTTISVFNGAAPGLITIFPNDMTGIKEGMLLNFNGGTLAVVELAANGYFTCYLPVTPANGWTITSGQVTAVPSASPGTITQYLVGIPGAEFDGIPQNGYSSADIVHVAIGIADPVNITDIRLRILVGDTTGTNYYEKEILPSQIQPVSSVTSTATETLPSVTQNVASGVLGPYTSPESVAAQAQPLTANPVPAGNAPSNPIWTEFDIPKNTFMQVGKAGSGNYTWANVTGVQVVSVGTAANIWIGSIYVAGGYGPAAQSLSANVPLIPYVYCYTYRNPVTGLESNPSPLMISNNAVQPLRQGVKLTMASSYDPQVSGMPNVPAPTTNESAIAVYRSGGTFADGLYRLVGYATNAVDGAGVPLPSIFEDHQSDASLVGAPLLYFDNDPPVRSTLPIPFHAKWAAWSGAFTGAPGVNEFSVTVISAPNPTDFTTFLNIGSVITIAPNTSVQETCAVIARTATTIITYFQYDHSNATTSSPNPFVTCDSVVGQACNLALNAFDSIFLAGDQNNPHVLYKSKTGQPEVFPVVELATGIADQINVGTPANPIINITEYNGQILCMNYDCLYVVQVFLGQMQAPIRTAATRGLYTTMGWCRVDNEIWYVAYDGIYSWSGGASTKRSEPIDPLFHGMYVGPYAPIDLTAYDVTIDPSVPQSPKDNIQMYYSKQRVYMIYRNINGQIRRLRYDTLYDRWAVEVIGDALAGSAYTTAVFVEEENGFVYDESAGFVVESDVLLAKSLVVSATDVTAYLYCDDVGTSDGWVNDPTDGAPINFSFQPAAYTMEMPSFQKQYSDCITELNNDAGLVQIQTYYNFSKVPDSTDFFTIPVPSPSQGRKRSIFSFQNGFGKEAYALQFRYSGSTTGNVTFYTNTFNYFSLDQLQIGRAFDWDDLGSPDDKRLYEVTFWYDAKTAPHVWVLDAITGVTNNQTVFQDVQEFTLEPLNGTFTGPTWTQVTFPINDNILTAEGIPNSIVKKIRLRPKNPGGSGGQVCTLDSSTQGGVTGQFGNQPWGIFKNGVNFFRVLFDGGPANKVYVLQSTDLATWVDVTGSKVINGGAAPATGVAVAWDGTNIYVLYASFLTSNPRPMTISVFDTGTVTWASDIPVTPMMDTTPTTSGYGPTNMSMAVKPNGKIEIMYNGGVEVISGSTYARAFRAEYASATWSSGTEIAGQAGLAKDFLSSQILVNDSNRAHFVLQTIYPSATGYDIYHVSVPDAGSEQTFQLLTSDVSTRVRDFPTGVGLGLAYTDVLSVERIAIPYVGGGNATHGAPDFGPSNAGDVMRAVDANDPTWTKELFQTSTQISGFQPAFEVLISTAYDITSDSLYILWVTPTAYGTPFSAEVVSISGDVVYSVNSGAGWSAPITIDSFAAPIAASGVIGMFFQAGVLTTLIYRVDSGAF